MIVLRFKVQCQLDKAEDAGCLQGRDRPEPRGGVISFDIARDIADPNSIIAIEVFEDEAARERQASLPEIATVMGPLPEAVAGPPEATVFEVSSSADAI